MPTDLAATATPIPIAPTTIHTPVTTLHKVMPFSFSPVTFHSVPRDFANTIASARACFCVFFEPRGRLSSVSVIAVLRSSLDC